MEHLSLMTCVENLINEVWNNWLYRRLVNTSLLKILNVFRYKCAHDYVNILLSDPLVTQWPNGDRPGSTLARVLAQCVFGTKPISEQMLIYSWQMLKYCELSKFHWNFNVCVLFCFQKKRHFKMPFSKCRPFRSDPHVLKRVDLWPTFFDNHVFHLFHECVKYNAFRRFEVAEHQMCHKTECLKKSI